MLRTIFASVLIVAARFLAMTRQSYFAASLSNFHDYSWSRRTFLNKLCFASFFFPCRDCCFIAYWLHGDGGANFQSWNIMHPCKRWRSLTLVRWLFSSTTSPLIGFTHRPHNGHSTAVQSWSLVRLDEALKLNEAAWDCHNAKKRKEKRQTVNS